MLHIAKSGIQVLLFNNNYQCYKFSKRGHSPLVTPKTKHYKLYTHTHHCDSLSYSGHLRQPPPLHLSRNFSMFLPAMKRNKRFFLTVFHILFSISL